MKSKEVQKKAALLAYVLWSGLEKQKAIIKRQYLLYNELGFPDMLAKCSWCEYLLEEGDCSEEKCRNCPLLKAGGGSCATTNLFFDAWAFSVSPEDKAKYAGDIARVAWEEYKQLGG